MADVKISALPQDTAPTVTDKIPAVDTETTTTKRITISDLITLAFNNIPAASYLATLSPRNLLINGNFDIWQRGTSFAAVNDDTYGVDRWTHLCEANGAWTFAQDTDIPAGGGAKYSVKATNVTANMQGGMVTILEGKDTTQFVGKNVSLNFYAKTASSEISKLRAAILSWTSTEDVVTSDVVGTWAQNGTNPTWATNWTMENIPVDLVLTNSWQLFSVENVAIDTAGTKNVAVVIWVDDGTITAADRLWLSQVNLIVSPKAQPINPVNYADELQRCRRYYQQVTEPHHMGMVNGGGNGVSRMGWQLAPQMRISPTVIATTNIPVFDASSVSNINSITIFYNNQDRLQYDGNISPNLTAARPAVAYAAGPNTPIFKADAEI